MVIRRPVAAVLSGGVIALTSAAGLAVWSQLPTEIVTQFSVSGTPTTTVSKPVGVFRFPAIMALTVVVFRGVFRVDPPATTRTESVIELSTVCVLSVLHLSVLAWNLGYPISIDLITVGSILWAVALVVYLYRQEHT